MTGGKKKKSVHQRLLVLHVSYSLQSSSFFGFHILEVYSSSLEMQMDRVGYRVRRAPI